MLAITRSASQLQLTCKDEDGELRTWTLSDESSNATIRRTIGCVSFLTGLSREEIELRIENA